MKAIMLLATAAIHSNHDPFNSLAAVEKSLSDAAILCHSVLLEGNPSRHSNTLVRGVCVGQHIVRAARH